ncbi:MAG: alkaline phosphatase PhoX [Solirubrobacterales bacterium]
MLRRREFIRTGVVAAGVLAFGPRFWEQALASATRSGHGPYGPLGPPDESGIMLPKGFRSRVIARGGRPVPGTSYVWHIFSDGAATFRTADGGWILVSNAEVPTAADTGDAAPLLGSAGEGGASAIRFAPRGKIVRAYRILGDTSTNCAGGPTPWGTWLSCEEHPRGRVWECDPRGRRDAQARPALGVFTHEAACVDRKRGHVYLTEDTADGGFYRFSPRRKGDLREGRLEIASVRTDRRVDWLPVPDPAATGTPTRHQVPEATRFPHSEGIWYDHGHVYIATTGDSRIRRYNVRTGQLRVIYDPERLTDPPLTHVDNITVSRAGDLYVCEDGGADPFDIAVITPSPNRIVARLLKLTGPEHNDPEIDLSSEVAGVCFDPSGRRMYFASQRAFGLGAVYEVTGPFRRKRR